MKSCLISIDFSVLLIQSNPVYYCTTGDLMVPGSAGHTLLSSLSNNLFDV